MAYEFYCWHCRVSHPPGTKQCIHCGGPVRAERPDSSTRLTTTREAATIEIEAHDAESGAAEEQPQPPRGLRMGVTAMWVLLAIAASVYRACSGG